MNVFRTLSLSFAVLLLQLALAPTLSAQKQLHTRNLHRTQGAIVWMHPPTIAQNGDLVYITDRDPIGAGSDLFITRIDTDGKQVFMHRLPSSWLFIRYEAKMTACANGDFLLASELESTEGDFLFAARFDENGLMLWAHAFHAPLFLPTSSFARNSVNGLLELEDGTFLLSGSSAFQNGYIFKIDADGKPLQLLVPDQFFGMDGLKLLRPTDDGFWAIMQMGGTDAITRFNSDLEVVWSQRISTLEDIRDLILINENEIALSGRGFRYPAFVTIDSDGEPGVAVEYRDTSDSLALRYSRIEMIQPVRNGEAYLATMGAKYNGSFFVERAVVAHFDRSGNLLNDNLYRMSINGPFIYPTGNNTYSVFAGYLDTLPELDQTSRFIRSYEVDSWGTGTCPLASNILETRELTPEATPLLWNTEAYPDSVTVSDVSGHMDLNVAMPQTKNICMRVSTQDAVAEASDFTVFPNPTADQLTIKQQFPATEPIAIRMYSMTGQEVINTASNDLETSLDTRHLSPGMYFLVLQNGATLQREKIQVVR